MISTADPDKSLPLGGLPGGVARAAVARLTAVEITPQAAEKHLTLILDGPAPGAPIDAYCIRLHGMVHADETLRFLAFQCDYETIGYCHIPVPNPAAAGTTAHRPIYPRRFEIQISLLGLPPEFRINVIGRSHIDAPLDPNAVHLCQITGMRTYHPTAANEDLRPLLVSGLGRSGTSFLTGLLALHPQTVALPRHPFEGRAAHYWVHALRVLTDPADPQRSTGRAGFESNRYSIGHNPFFDPYFFVRQDSDGAIGTWFAADHVRHTCELIKSNIARYYRCMARDLDKPHAAYFVEKAPPHSFVNLFSELYSEVKEIFVIRDPRDTLCSVRHFFKEPFYRSDTYIEALRIDYDRLLDSYRQRHASACLIPFEALTREPLSILDRISAFIGGEPRVAAGDWLALYNHRFHQESHDHRTAQGSEDPIGRWRQDLSPHDIALCEHHFAGILETLETLMPDHAPLAG